MTSAEPYAAMVDAYNEWFATTQSPQQDRWGGRASRLRVNLDRPHSLEEEAIASFLTPDDTLLDVGGGAGRLGLRLAGLCHEVVNVEPSPGMQAAFVEAAADAGIKNVRAVQTDWLEAEGVTGDVCITAHVTYFVRDIEAFVRRLDRAARRRVLIVINSIANPNNAAPFYELLYQKPYPRCPGHRELLPVLWDLGILPDVRVSSGIWTMTPVESRDAEIERRANSDWVEVADRDRARELFAKHFDELYETRDGSIVERARADARGMLITWQPGHSA